MSFQQPYIGNPFQRPQMQRTPEQIQADFNNALSQYQSLYSGYGQPYAPQPQTQRRGGEYTEVSDSHEMEEAPTPLDGTPKLFFDFKNHIFWSKKYTNGGYTIQSYSFAPVTGTAPTNEPVDYTQILGDSDNKVPVNPSSSISIDKQTIEQIASMVAEQLQKESKNGNRGSSRVTKVDQESNTSSGIST